MSGHGPAIFVGDAPGLDFVNSIATPVDTPVDWIDDGAGLLNWLEQAQLVPPKALKSIRAQALPGELDEIAAQARNLREWFRSFVQAHKGRPLTPDKLRELEPLNRLLERDEAFSRIVLRPDARLPTLANCAGIVIFPLDLMAAAASFWIFLPSVTPGIHSEIGNRSFPIS